jgi:hypothetical protein
VAELNLDVKVDVTGDEKLDGLNRSLDQTEAKSTKTGAVTTGIFQGIGQAATSAGLSLISSGVDFAIDKVGESISLASDKAEAASKVNVLYGDSAGKIATASETAAETVGMSSGAYLTSAGNLGNLLTNMDLSSASAADMSVDMLQLAADVGSFNNADPTEVVEAMGAAFRGESEPIRRFGVMLDEASIKAKAMELGLYDGVGALDASARATATYELILADTASAQGDFARTSDGLANQQRIASARMEDALTRIGEALMPLVNQLMPLLADAAVAVAEGIGGLVETVMAWVQDNQELIDSVVELGRVLWDLYTKYIGVVIEVIGELAYRIGGLINLFIDLGGAIIDTGSAIVKVLSGDFEGAANSAQLALDRIGSFAENVQRAMGDSGRKAADEALIAAQVTTQAAEESASGAINALAGGYAAGVPEVTAAANDLAQPIPDAVGDAGTEAGQIAAQTPAQIASGLRSNRDAVGSAMDQLKEDIKDHIAPAKEIAKLEGMLSGKALTAGLKSTDPIVRAQATATVDTIETRLNELKGVGTTAGQTGAGAIPGGMQSKDPAVLAAARSTTAVVTTQFNTLETGSRIAAQTANLTLSSGLSAGTTAAARAGETVAAAWGNALTRTIAGYRDDIAKAAAYATAPIHGSSPPKVGPLREIDKWGENIGDAWLGGLERATGAVAVGVAGAGGGSVYNVTIQTGVGDPVAIGRETVAAIQAFERSSGRDWRSSV